MLELLDHGQLMARIKDLVSRDGAIDNQLGVGASTWYAEVTAPVPTIPGDDLYVTIPELNFDRAYKWGPVKWGGRKVPPLGSGLLVTFDNRQQLWAVLAIAETDTFIIANVRNDASIWLDSSSSRFGLFVGNDSDPAGSFLGSSLETDSFDRYTTDISGKHQWGSGAAALDANLYRSGVNALKTDSAFNASALSVAGAPVETQVHAAATYSTPASVATAIAAQGLPKITASAMSGGPPASPNNGDIWIATAVDTNGTAWQFRFNSGSSSTYKWQFIGGAPLFSGVIGSLNLSTTGQTDLTGGPTIALPRSGDYLVDIGVTIDAGAGQTEATFGIKGSTSGVLANFAILIPGSPAFWQVNYGTDLVTGIAPQTLNITCAIATSGVATAFTAGQLKVTPVRIS